jgi:hypothetical protein
MHDRYGEGSSIRGIEGRGAEHFELARNPPQALGVPSREDHAGPLSACSPGRFEPDAGATADHDDGLPEDFSFTPKGRGSGCGAHGSSR